VNRAIPTTNIRFIVRIEFFGTRAFV
jgi:hypothetical protein